MNNDKTFSTDSLVIAATLFCMHIQLEDVVKEDNNKAVFLFPNNQDLKEIIRKFWKRELLVEPNSFFEAQKFLKSRIYGS